jgi:DNA processing protein
MCIAVVGTRRPTSAGVALAEKLTRQLAEAGFTIVSGLAAGIDTIVHKATLSVGGSTVAVTGCGLDIAFPKRNEGLQRTIGRSGSLVSEYERGTPPNGFHFPARNRIIAGLAVGALVIEGGMRSGALITARYALDFNRHIWAVPGSVRNPMAAGPNELIRRGEASLVTEVEHIFEEVSPPMVWDRRSEDSGPLPGVEEDEMTILMRLDDSPLTPDDILSDTELTPGRGALVLTRLEVRGFARRHPLGYELTESGARVRERLVADL